MDYQNKVTTANTSVDFIGTLDWLKRMNGAIEYIENHLLEQIDYDSVAQIACCSVYHFQRFFSFITGVPMSEYIRRRRLTLAAFEMQSRTTKVIDIALKYGYESPESFTRAFKNMHGIQPSSVRNNGVHLKAFPRMTFQLSIKGDVEMNYRIEQKEAFEVFGVETEVGTTDAPSQTAVPNFWAKCREDGTLERMHEDIGIENDIMLYAAMYNCVDTKHNYMICYKSPATGAPQDYTTLKIPAATWAVFSIENLSIVGDSSSKEPISDTWKRIFTEWFPTSDYELADVPELEMHFNQGDGKYLCEIWIPVIKRKL